MDLQEFRLQFGRFFAGDRPVPPEDLRQDLQVRLRQTRAGGGSAVVRSVADSFRLTQLEAQFNAYNELFNRRLRQRDEGSRRSGAPSTSRVFAPASPVGPIGPMGPIGPVGPIGSTRGVEPDLSSGVRIPIPDGAARPSAEAVASLHRSLYPLATTSGGATTGVPDLGRFTEFLSSQMESLRRRTGCREVLFRVADQGGRRKLMAKPLGASTVE